MPNGHWSEDLETRGEEIARLHKRLNALQARIDELLKQREAVLQLIDGGYDVLDGKGMSVCLVDEIRAVYLESKP